MYRTEPNRTLVRTYRDRRKTWHELATASQYRISDRTLRTRNVLEQQQSLELLATEGEREHAELSTAWSLVTGPWIRSDGIESSARMETEEEKSAEERRQKQQ